MICCRMYIRLLHNKVYTLLSASTRERNASQSLRVLGSSEVAVVMSLNLSGTHFSLNGNVIVLFTKYLPFQSFFVSQ